VATRGHQAGDMGRGHPETAAEFHHGRASAQQVTDHPSLGALVVGPPEHLRPRLGGSRCCGRRTRVRDAVPGSRQRTYEPTRPVAATMRATRSFRGEAVPGSRPRADDALMTAGPLTAGPPPAATPRTSRTTHGRSRSGTRPCRRGNRAWRCTCRERARPAWPGSRGRQAP